MAVGRLLGWGTHSGLGPTPTAATTLPIWEAGGQLPVSVAAPTHWAIPAKEAAMPRGRVRAKSPMSASGSSLVRVRLKGVKAPPLESVLPACSFGAKPPSSQPSVISIGASPTAGGPPDQGTNS